MAPLACTEQPSDQPTCNAIDPLSSMEHLFFSVSDDYSSLPRLAGLHRFFFLDVHQDIDKTFFWRLGLKCLRQFEALRLQPVSSQILVVVVVARLLAGRLISNMCSAPFHME